jgi:hypothetical protein
MLRSSFVLSLALCAAVLVGCEKDDTQPSTPPAPTNPPAQPQATGTGVVPSGEQMKKAGDAATDTAKTAAGNASKTAGDIAKGAGDAAKGATDTAIKAPDAASASGTADAAAATAKDSAAAKEAQTLLEKVQTYIKEKKFDDADAALKQLEGMQDKLPESVKVQLPTIRKSLDTAKSLTGSTPAAPSGAELPKVPGLNK